MKKQKILSIVNQKGGVGKTTTAVNLATALVAVGKNVLLIDLDPQGNASTGLGIGRQQRQKTTYEILIGEAKAEECILRTQLPKLDIITSTVDLSGAELELINIEKREFQMKNALGSANLPYDYILIDCPPSLGLLTLNALVASSRIIVPLQCEFYALEGLSHLLRTIELVKKRLNPELEIQGVVLTMFDRRNSLTQQVEFDVRDFLKDKVYQTVIPRNVRVSEAPSHGMPVLLYDLNCSGAQAYARLAKEVLKQENTIYDTRMSA